MKKKVDKIVKLLVASCIFLGATSFGVNDRYNRQDDFNKTKNAAPAGEVVNVADFGVKSNSFENASPAIQKAIAYCKGKANITLSLPGGRIDLWPEGAAEKELYISNSTESDTLPKVKHIAFLMEAFQNLTIEGNNTLVVLHGKMVSFAIIGSQNIIVRDLAFDYDRPTMSELRIDSISPNVVKASFHRDSRYFIDKGKISLYGEGWKAKSFHTIAFDSAGNTMKYSSFSPFQKSIATQIQPGVVKFEGEFAQLGLQRGQVLTIRDPYRDNCGGFIWLSKDILLQRVKMHYMHGLGIVSQFSENITYKKVEIAPRVESGRIVSSFADCFHFSGCRGQILIDSCFTSGSHDDPINVHGTHLKITAVSSARQVTVRFMHHQTYGFEAFFSGDSIAFIHPQTLQTLGYAKIAKASLVNKNEMELETETQLPAGITQGICIENISWTPEVSIRNSRFERTNTRGILITTRRKVIIEKNYFLKTGMHAILIANDAASWYESGPVQDLTIRNNVFEACGYNQGANGYVIAVAPENHTIIKNFFVHRNIAITNNVFKVSSPFLLTAKSVDRLVFSNNVIQKANETNIDKAPVIQLESCANVSIRNNENSQLLPAQINTIRMERKTIKTDLAVQQK